LKDEYELWQFHAHWGSDNSQGSEHTLNGQSFPAEVFIARLYKFRKLMVHDISHLASFGSLESLKVQIAK